jgi:hypothetical protein
MCALKAMEMFRQTHPHSLKDINTFQITSFIDQNRLQTQQSYNSSPKSCNTFPTIGLYFCRIKSLIVWKR